jgi:hypothetical protein
LNWLFRQNRKAKYLARGSSWKVTAPNEFPVFLRNLPAILPGGSVLCLEGAGATDAEREFLGKRAPPYILALPRGAILPRVDMFHMIISEENANGLAFLFAAKPHAGIPTHVQAYLQESILLQWFDASAKDPLFISKQIPEETLKAFCHSISCSYTEH